MSPENGPGPEFLKDKYWDKAPFRDAVEKTARRKQTDPKDLNKPEKIIPLYLERVKRIAQREDPKTGETGSFFYRKLLIKPENISDDWIKNILLGNYAESKGYTREQMSDDARAKDEVVKMFNQETSQDFNTYEIPKTEKDTIVEQTIQDQRDSLDQWFSYFATPEAENYPDAFKYWALTQVTKLGSWDSGRRQYNERNDRTSAPFAPLNQQAFALVVDQVQKKLAGEATDLPLEDEKNEELQKYLKGENFGKLYAWAMEYVNSLKLPTEGLANTNGEWKLYTKGMEVELANSIREFNTQWCIAGLGTARSYLDNSNIWIYYSEDKNKKIEVPRAAIVADGEKVREVRGIIGNEQVKQHLDDYITPVVAEKLASKDIAGGEQWQINMDQMKKLAEIHLKKEPLNRDDLIFLYEIDRPIEATGYGKDPRVAELRSQRDPKEDAPIVLECQPNEIAWGQDQINQNTKAYIGVLFPGIFQLAQLEHIYTTFPEGIIRKSELEIGTVSEGELRDKLNEVDEEGNRKIGISDYAQDMLDKMFQDKEYQERNLSRQGNNPERFGLVRLKVKDFGFSNNATTDEIYARASELGLDICPAEVGFHQRLKDEDQPLNEWYLIAMKPITDRDGYASVFDLRRDVSGLWLDHNWAYPAYRWNPSREFMFRLRQVSLDA